jgi:biotin transporter BioY
MAVGETGGAAVPMGTTGGHKLVYLAMAVLASGAQWKARV